MKILISMVLIGFLLVFNCFAEGIDYCTPEVREKGVVPENQIECKLVQLAIDYINENTRLEISKVYAFDEYYKPNYSTLVVAGTDLDKPWKSRYYNIIIWFDKDFNIIQIDKY